MKNAIGYLKDRQKQLRDLLKSLKAKGIAYDFEAVVKTYQDEIDELAVAIGVLENHEDLKI